MGIQLMGAILARACYTDGKGHFHIVDPTAPMLIPPELRKTMKPGEGQTLGAELPDMVAVIILWGGQEGEEFNVSTALYQPGAEPIASPVLHRTWGKGEATRIMIDMKRTMPFTESGVYKIKVLVNGEPIGELPLPIFWEDEFPG